MLEIHKIKLADTRQMRIVNHRLNSRAGSKRISQEHVMSWGVLMVEDACFAEVDRLRKN